jgi:hypothetical protein
LPNFGSEIRNSNIVENWLFHFAGSGDDLYLAFSDVTDSRIFYYGVILNRPIIRESLNLAKSTAKTSNISVQIPDFNYLGNPISELLVFSSNYFINQIVTVHCKINNQTKVELGKFRLTNVSMQKDKISLSLTAHRPFADITFPQDKTTTNLIPIPVSFGNYTKNSATTFASPQYASDLTSKAYRPVPFNIIQNAKSLYIDGSATSDAELAVYEKNLDVFVPLEDAESSTNNTDNAHHGQVKATQKRAFYQRAHSVEEILSQVDSVSNAANAIDADNSTFSQWSNSDVATDTQSAIKYEYSFKPVSGLRQSEFITAKEADGDVAQLDEALNSSETGVDITNGDNLSNFDVIKVDDEEMNINSISSNTLSVGRAFNGTTAASHDDSSTFSQNQTLNVLFIRYAVEIVSLIGNSSRVRITWDTDTGRQINSFTSSQSIDLKKIQLTGPTEKLRIKADFISQDTGATLPTLIANVKIYDIFVLTQRIEQTPLEKLYTANDGLPANGYNSSAAITEIHEAHRDLLSRFAGLSDSDPNGWSDLDSDKNWVIRYWQNDIIDLEKALEKLQFEGGFVYSPNRGYIHIKDSESADITLSKSDLADVTIKHTPFTELQTNINVNYQKHPAENRYIVSVDSVNSTTRTNYNIPADENKTQVNLDTYISPTVPSSPSSNPNDDWYTYYDNIFGSVKAIVEATIVNSKFYNHDDNADLLGIGSKVKFEDMYPEKIFGKAFTNLIFIITDFKRSPGKISFTAREIA